MSERRAKPLTSAQTRCKTRACIQMGGCQNYCALLSPLNTRRRIILRTQKEPISLTTTHKRALKSFCDLHVWHEKPVALHQVQYLVMLNGSLSRVKTELEGSTSI